MVGRVLEELLDLGEASDAAPLGCFEPVCRFQRTRDGGWVGIGTGGGATENMGGGRCGREGLYGVKGGR